MNEPRCSVIIPSYDRCHSLEQLLEGLSRQTLPADAFEVIVVLDGSTDASVQMLTAWQASGRLPGLRWRHQPRKGQAAARTAGAREAHAPVLVFLDDDIVPEPGLLAAHLRWYVEGAAIAVLGAAPVALPEKPSLYDLVIWSWWEDTYHRRTQPGNVLGYRDFCAGNVSLRRDDFFRVGGFDPAFRGYGAEDFDLGYRLQRSGVRFVVDPSAVARHHHRGTAEQVFRNMRQEGWHDVLLGRKHPELRRSLRLMYRTQGAHLVFALPACCAMMVVALRWQLRFYERANLRGSWRRLFGKLRHYSYWRGVQEALGTWQAYQRYTLDITGGLPEDLSSLSVDGPSEIIVKGYGGVIGWLPLREPIEGLTPEQLADRIVDELGPRLWMVLAQQGMKA